MISHDTLTELIAAWALDACPPEETELVEAHLDTCDTCAHEARELREAAADLGGAHLSPPPGSLDRLLTAAPARRRPATPAPAYATSYAAQIAALDLLLTDLPAADWHRTAAHGATAHRHAAPTHNTANQHHPTPGSPGEAAPRTPDQHHTAPGSPSQHRTAPGSRDQRAAGANGAGDRRGADAHDELTVHDLLAHLIAIDGLLADALGLPVEPPVEPGQRLTARTTAVVDFERQRPPEQTRQAWRAQADAICRALHEQPNDVTVRLGRPFSLVDALTARAYETWIHTEDIAATTGRPAVPPLPEHVHPMAAFAMRVLPRVVFRRIEPPHNRYVRLHLTGPGGGTWTVPLDPATVVPAVTKPSASITVDVIEFCRLAGDRRDPAHIAAAIEGDAKLARDFLAAVPAMAPVP